MVTPGQDDTKSNKNLRGVLTLLRSAIKTCMLLSLSLSEMSHYSQILSHGIRGNIPNPHKEHIKSDGNLSRKVWMDLGLVHDQAWLGMSKFSFSAAYISRHANHFTYCFQWWYIQSYFCYIISKGKISFTFCHYYFIREYSLPSLICKQNRKWEEISPVEGKSSYRQSSLLCPLKVSPLFLFQQLKIFNITFFPGSGFGFRYTIWPNICRHLPTTLI